MVRKVMTFACHKDQSKIPSVQHSSPHQKVQTVALVHGGSDSLVVQTGAITLIHLKITPSAQTTCLYSQTPFLITPNNSSASSPQLCKTEWVHTSTQDTLRTDAMVKTPLAFQDYADCRKRCQFAPQGAPGDHLSESQNHQQKQKMQLFRSLHKKGLIQGERMQGSLEAAQAMLALISLSLDGTVGAYKNTAKGPK